MTDDQQQTALTPDANLSPHLQRTMETWYAARHRFQIEPVRQNCDAYDAATNALGQAFLRWKVEQPELFEQFRLWLHLES
jgi:hypothetical protein